MPIAEARRSVRTASGRFRRAVDLTARAGHTAAMHLERGQRIARYRLIEPLGRGGMAEVFRARKEGPRLFTRDKNGRHFSREVAIKLILPHLSSEDSFRELFSREAHLASLLDHPNIVAIQDYGTLDGADYIVMEYLRGMDLRELMRFFPKGQRLPLAESTGN